MASASTPAPRVNNGLRWFQLCVGIVGMIGIANLQYGWTLFVNPLVKQLNVTAAAVQIAFTLFVLFETWPNFLEAYFVDRYGPKVVVIIGGVLVGLAWALDSVANSLPMLYVGGILAGVGAGIVYGTAAGSALKWFPDRRGLAAGLTAAGFGAGAALTVIPIYNQIGADGSGYQSAFLTWGIIQGVVVVIAGFLLRAPKPGETPVAPISARVQQAAKDSTPTEMLKTPTFWLLYLMFTLAVTGGLMIVAVIAPLAVDFKVDKSVVNLIGGVSFIALPFALSLDKVMNGITRPLFGWISDHIGRENTMFMAFTLEGLAILSLITFAGDPLLFVILTGLSFFGWGEVYSLFPATSGDFFGRKFATTNYGLLYTAKGTASVLVPIGTALAAGAAFDFRADILLVIGFLLLFFTTFFGPSVLHWSLTRTTSTILYVVAGLFIFYAIVLTVGDVWTPFTAKFAVPNIGWKGVFYFAVAFDWISALLAMFVLKPLRIRSLASQAAAPATAAAPAAE
jgi:MFS transporter, OFA family, oxalate/formate antiporter